MTLGEKLRLAREEAGLSQRQLSEGIVTRNMLSAIEHDAARPSLSTLEALAQRLGRTSGSFLEPDAVLSPNQDVMVQARVAFRGARYDTVLSLLRSAYVPPDETFDEERDYLVSLSLLKLAEKAYADQRLPLALRLLEQIVPCLYWADALEQDRRVLLGLCREDADSAAQAVSDLLPRDGELLLRARALLAAGKAGEAGVLLDQASKKRDPRWGLLRGRCYMAQKEYAAALPCFQLAEEKYPQEALPHLEVCYRELKDFQNAYLTAIRMREL